MIRACLLLVLAATTAHANVWENAIARGKPDPMQDKYESELLSGDEHARQANARNITYKEAKNQVQAAITSYRAAALAKPKEAEPYFRLGMLIHSFYLDCEKVPQLQFLNSVLCNKDVFDRKRAEEVIEAWNQFELRAPNDPRLGVESGGDTQILFERAILHTRLATKPHLEAAAVDYEKILARNDRAQDSVERVLGNLAETYMMLGRMDESLDLYREVLRSASDTSTWYGYAVALDRDEHAQAALDIVRSLGEDQRELFRRAVERGITFFVPEGEKYYYFALSDEAFGHDDEAIANWRAYVASGAHPEFQPRAKFHLDGLTGRKKRRTMPIEPPWQEVFR